MTKLDEVRSKIIEAVPEIVELAVGCEFLRPKTDYRGRPLKDRKTKEPKYSLCRLVAEGTHGGFTYSVDGQIEMEYGMYRGDADSPSVIYDLRGYQVIGRPVSLADVLTVIDNQIWRVDMTLMYTGQGLLNMEANVYEEGTNSVFWNTHKPLDEQEEDVVEFLHKLLIV